MTVKEELIAEIEQLDEQYLELLYKIVRQFPHIAAKENDSTSHSAFLLSMAGMFDSGQSDSSENVSEIVKNFVTQKHEPEIK